MSPFAVDKHNNNNYVVDVNYVIWFLFVITVAVDDADYNNAALCGLTYQSQSTLLIVSHCLCCNIMLNFFNRCHVDLWIQVIIHTFLLSPPLSSLPFSIHTLLLYVISMYWNRKIVRREKDAGALCHLTLFIEYNHCNIIILQCNIIIRAIAIVVIYL